MTDRIDPKEIMKQAEAEIREEQFRAAVELAKAKIRKRRPFWDRVFPWRVVFISKRKELYS